MPRYVYVTESTGEEAQLDLVFSTPSKAIRRLREHYCYPVLRGAISRLKNGEVVWAEDPETNSYEACARRMEVL